MTNIDIMARKKQKLKIDYKYNLKEYWSFMKKYKLLLVLTFIVVTLHEFKQIADKYLFKIVVDESTAFSAGSILQSQLVRVLLIVAGIYILATIMSAVLNYLKLHFVNKMEVSTIFDMKKKYFEHILDLDHGFHTTHKTGSLISRIGRGAGAMERLSDTIIFEFTPLIMQFAFAVLALIYLDVSSALIIGITMVVFISYSYYRQKISEESNVSANKAEDIEKGNLADFFTNVDSIRYFGKEGYIKQKYKELTTRTRNEFFRNWNFWRGTSAMQSLIIGAGAFLLIYFSVKQFLVGQVTLGTIAFIYATYIGLMGPMFGFVHGIRNFSRSLADFQELFDYSKHTPQIKDKQDAKSLEVKNGEIEFKNVGFNYGERRIFSNFNLKIKKNEKVALVGHSGSGKTTLVKLLYRLYDADSGEIKIDSEDVRNLKQNSLRSEMSIVPQECVLFDDTVYNNVAFSNPKASREEVLQAIKFAQLDKIIRRFPNKENTIVGERGVRLSGGEKQRVSIARAILANKKILVLDEATSSLDSETEHEIQQDLRRLMEGRTSIIIAHRLSTIMHADRIIVMKDGKIVQEGRHNQLITRVGEYRKLWNLQKGGYIGE